MEDWQEATVKSLVAVAWADGKVEGEESKVIDALIDAFALSDEDAQSVKDYAKSPKTLDDVPLTELSAHDRRMLLQHAVIVTYSDGEQSEEERAILDDLVTRLKIPAEEATEILDYATGRAKRLLELL